MFSDKVQAIPDLLGNLTWVALGVLVIGFTGYRLWKSRATSGEAVEQGSDELLNLPASTP